MQKVYYIILSYQIPLSRKIKHTSSIDGQVQFKTEGWKDLYMLTFQIDTCFDATAKPTRSTVRNLLKCPDGLR